MFRPKGQAARSYLLLKKAALPGGRGDWLVYTGIEKIWRSQKFIKMLNLYKLFTIIHHH